MTADAYSRPYVVGNNAGGVNAKGYYILSPEGGATQVHAYAVGTTGSGLKAGSGRSQSYAVLTNPAATTAQVAYVAHRNDVSVLRSLGYVVLQTFFPPYGDLDVEFPFTENRFPESVSYGSSGGPGFKTSVFAVDSGLVQTNPEWDRLRARYDVTFDHCPAEDIEKVEEFFYAMRGKAIGFRFKDWNDYQINNQNVVVGDGISTEFQLFKRYRSGGAIFDRIITKPVRGTVGSIYMDGTEYVLNRDYYMNYSSGVITFDTAPVSGVVGKLEKCQFDVPVRFDTDKMVTSAEDFNQYSISNLEMIEILV